MEVRWSAACCVAADGLQLRDGWERSAGGCHGLGAGAGERLCGGEREGNRVEWGRGGGWVEEAGLQDGKAYAPCGVRPIEMRK